jgi:peptide-methionine (S)-S-oxide reductase
MIRRAFNVLLAALAISLIGAASLLGAAAQAAPAPAKTESAVFAGGCFWCMESDMKAIPGVISVQSGYTGGQLKNPRYEDVVTERTGHYESVKVTFDPARISYQRLLTRYWKLVDPTDDGGQFCDRGPSYKTAVFVDGPAQRAVAEATRAEAAKALKTGKMTTQILPLQTFYPAEEYHRDYAKRNKAHYAAYREGCGRDRRLAQVWGGPVAAH